MKRAVRNIGRAMVFGLLLTGLTPSLLLAGAEHQQFLRDYLPGNYTLIGKAIDSDVSYNGTLTIAPTTEGFAITRHIGNARLQAKGRIEQATADKLEVLRIRFEEDGRQVESTCLIASDLDNYPRLSCQLYWLEGKTRQPGLEALFIKHQP